MANATLRRPPIPNPQSPVANLQSPIPQRRQIRLMSYGSPQWLAVLILIH